MIFHCFFLFFIKNSHIEGNINFKSEEPKNALICHYSLYYINSNLAS